MNINTGENGGGLNKNTATSFGPPPEFERDNERVERLMYETEHDGSINSDGNCSRYVLRVACAANGSQGSGRMRRCDLCGQRIAVNISQGGKSIYVGIEEQENKKMRDELRQAKVDAQTAWNKCKEYQQRLRRLGEE